MKNDARSLLQKAASLFALLMSVAVSAHADSKCPWVFFDLGKGSIVETPNPFPQSVFFAAGDAKNGDAFEYLTSLSQLGYTLGLLVNFPDDYDGAVWPPAEQHEARRAAKREFVKKLVQNGWTDQKHPMSGAGDWDRFWNLFGDRFIVTATDAESKTDSNILFSDAMKMAHAQGCDAVYESGIAAEQTRLAAFARANGNGIVPFFQGHDDGTDFYLDPARLPTYNSSWH